MIDANIETLIVGKTACIKKVMTEADIISFAGISEDFNPIHLDRGYAEKSRYKAQIIHGMMAASLFSGLFGTKLPGKGCVYKSQNLNFRRAIYVGDEVEAKIEIIGIDKKNRTIAFKTVCVVRGKFAIEGTAEIFLP
ncbi:MaoC family dehydratase [Polynucleobacter paneuropaeus]|jgi:3-hydroxybutyryl-CoA dehydratase|nr:MaoC family dehydratase [Polynucleobacter paneuropaeus]